MKVNMRYLLAATLSAALVAPVTSAAQAPKWEGAFGAGATIAAGKLADETKTGFNALASIGYNPSVLPFGLRLDLIYQDFRAVAREPGVYTVLGGEWYRQLGAALYARYATQVGQARPYLLAGAGWNYEWHSDRQYWPEKQNAIALNAGVGVDFRIMGATTFLEIRQLNVLRSNPLETRPPTFHREVPFSSIPVTVGFRF